MEQQLKDETPKRRGRGRVRWRVWGAAVGAVVLVAAAAVGLNRLWYGAPYPVADPDETGQRLRSHAQAVYDVLGLTEEQDVRVEPELCYVQGWRAGMIDQLEPDVYGMGLIWEVRMARDVIPAAMREVRDGLVRQGWQVAERNSFTDGPFLGLDRGENGLGLSVREDIDNPQADPFLRIYSGAPCSRIPDDWNGALPEAYEWDLDLPPLTPTAEDPGSR
jgi:hypothetical protein